MSKIKISYIGENKYNVFESLIQINQDKYDITLISNNDFIDKKVDTSDIDLIIYESLTGNIKEAIDFISNLRNKINYFNTKVFAIVNEFLKDDKIIAEKYNISEVFIAPVEVTLIIKSINNLYSHIKTGKPKILVIDDNADERTIVRYLLKQLGAEMLEAENGEDSKKFIYEEEISVIILDLYMPFMDGYETCKMFKNLEAFKHIPIIALTGSENSKDLKRMLDAGANDFIRKPFLFEEFIARIKAQLRVKDYFDEIQKHIAEEEKLNIKLLEVNDKINQLNIELEKMAITDYLTGTYNRGYILDYLDKEIERSKRYSQSFSIILFDVDNFKSFNDTYGHLIGDEVLKHFCNTIIHNIRKCDIFGRFGGEEFLLILPNSDEKHALILGEKLKDIIEKNILTSEELKLSITVSAGLTEIKKDDDSKSIIKRADDALLNAKKSGRNRVVVI